MDGEIESYTIQCKNEWMVVSIIVIVLRFLYGIHIVIGALKGWIYWNIVNVSIGWNCVL